MMFLLKRLSQGQGHLHLFLSRQPSGTCLGWRPASMAVSNHVLMGQSGDPALTSKLSKLCLMAHAPKPQPGPVPMAAWGWVWCLEEPVLMCPRPMEALTGGPTQGMSVWATLGTTLCLIPDHMLAYSPSPNSPSTDIWQEFGGCGHSMLPA